MSDPDLSYSPGGLHLFHGLASTCSKKVRLCLYEKGLPFESHLLDLQKFEQHRPEYLAINPNGVVPAQIPDPVNKGSHGDIGKRIRIAGQPFAL